MRITRIYFPEQYNDNQTYGLPETTSHYLIHVLRMKLGFQIQVFNGQGEEYTAEIIEIKKQTCTIKLISAISETHLESNLDLHLFQSIAKADKMDWIIQKAVELGVKQITPMLTQFTDVQMDEKRSEKRWQHWQEIMIHACEQSGRRILPLLNPIKTFDTALKDADENIKLIFHPVKNKFNLNEIKTPSSLAIFIGPEGGFSDDEIKKSLECNFQLVQLGPRILRTETAAVAAMSVCQLRFGDFI